MIKQTIIVPAEGFIGWGGGIDCIKYHLMFLGKISRDDPSIKILLLLPFFTIKDKIIRLIKNCIKFVIRRPINKYINYFNVFFSKDEQDRNIEIKKYSPNKEKGQYSIQWIVKKSINPIVFPTMKPLKNLGCKQIGYIPDLQHINLPQFFSNEECILRDKLFIGMLSECDGIIVNSKDVKNNVLKVYPEYAESAKIFSFPFLPVINEKFLDLDVDVDISKYSLPEKYFLISNQLWIHKDHKTAFKALQLIHKNGYNNIHILCTGNTYDYRFPAYYQEIQDFIRELNLEKYIRFLGFIPKNEQIAILRKSIGVVQPTLFEGGSGGGAVYEAVAYGIPAIVSDILVNQEINHPQVFFFQAQNPDKLAELMINLLNNQLPRPSLEELKTQRINNINQSVQFLQDMFVAITN